MSQPNYIQNVKDFHIASQCIPSEDNILLYANLIKEEQEELFLACSNEEYLDALCDLLYVCIGYALVFDIQVNELKIINHELGISEEGIIKGTNQLINLKNEDEIIRCLNQIYTHILDEARIRFYDFEGAWDEVHRSNLDKFRLGAQKDKYGKVKKPLGWKAPNLKPYIF